MECYANFLIPDTIGGELTYQVPSSFKNPQVGHAYIVPVRARKCIGILNRIVEKPTSYKCKPVIDEVSYTKPLPNDLIDLCQWMSHYYLTDLGYVIKHFAPGFF